MKIAAESLHLAGELEFLERQVKAARTAVSQGVPPPRYEQPYQVDGRHAAQLQSYARALFREWLEGKSQPLSTWYPDPDEPLTKRRIQVIAAVQQQIARWETDKAAGRLLPPVHDAPKFGDMIMDGLNQPGGVR
jgi:hypothetical protein